MKQLTKHDVNKLTTKELQDSLPFLVISDGEVIAAMVPACDVNRLENCTSSGSDVNKGGLRPITELPLSKKRQAEGRLSENS